MSNKEGMGCLERARARHIYYLDSMFEVIYLLGLNSRIPAYIYQRVYCANWWRRI